MGNRAVITWGSVENYQTKVGVYLHWNGGKTSVESFLNYCRLKGYPEPDKDSYGLARFIQVVTNFFGGSLSVDVNLCVNLDCNNYDNGLYLCKGWEIVDHLFTEPHQDQYDPQEFIKSIDESMPAHEQLGNLLNAYQVAFEDLKIGDHVFVKDFEGRISELPILGFGDGVINGRNCTGLPFVDYFNKNNANDAKLNLNNYVCLKFSDKLRNTTGIDCANGYCYAIKKADL